jgi:hypothetical protein
MAKVIPHMFRITVKEADPPIAGRLPNRPLARVPGSATDAGLGFFRCSVDLEMLSSRADM